MITTTPLYFPRSRNLRLPAISPKIRLGLYLSGLMLLFLYCGPLLRSIDPEDPVADPGILSLIVLALGTSALFIVLSLWLLRLLWPECHKYRIYDFETGLSFSESSIYILMSPAPI
jgi:hypothetical protein